MNPEPGVLVGSKYRLDRPLGAGGMGAVWVARHTQLDVDVAVKLMAPGLAAAPSAVARFQREARAAALLKTPHVVHIYDFGVEEGSPFIAMELLEGEDLDHLLQREERLSLPRAADILTQVAKGLRAAHDAGIVHRDLKPSNIFLADAGGEMMVKLLDFGIAKEMGPAPSPRASTTTGVVLGSPLYMSPEQARGGSVGPPSDLWSMAVVAFELVTGKHPFLGASMGDVIVKICGDTLPVPSRLAPGLPKEIDAFFARALERDPARRFGSARELSDAFSAIAAAHAEEASRPTLTAIEVEARAAAATVSVEVEVEPTSTERAATQAISPQAISPQAISPQAISPQAISPQAITPGRGREEATAPLVLAVEEKITAEEKTIAEEKPTAEEKPPAPVASTAPGESAPPPPQRRRVLLAGVLLAAATAAVAAYVGSTSGPGNEGAAGRPTASPNPPPSSSGTVRAQTSTSSPPVPVSVSSSSPPVSAPPSALAPPASAPAPRASARVPPRASAAPQTTAAPTSAPTAAPTVSPAPGPSTDGLFGLPVPP